MKLVEQFVNGTLNANTGSPWKCPECGEEVDGQFTNCWQCGTNRPAETQT